MDATLLREVVSCLKDAISFMDKVKIDKKQKSERETVLNKIKSLLSRCDKLIAEDEPEMYNDVEVGKPVKNKKGNQEPSEIYNDVEGGEQYDDVQMGVGAKESEDDTYDNTNNPEDTYDDTVQLHAEHIQPTEFEKLTKPTIAEYMEMRKEKMLLKGSWQKKWIAVHNSVFYIYDNPKDKKQKDAFKLSGWKFQVREDLAGKDAKRLKRCFEIKNDTLKKSYEFCTTDRESLTKWQAALSLANISSGSENVSFEETYDDVGDSSNPTIHVESSPKSKKKFGSFGIFGKKKTNKLSESKEKLEDDSTYDDTNNDHYDDTNLDLTYDDTLQPCDETYEGFDAEPEVKSPITRELPPPPSPISGGPIRRPSHREELPPIPTAKKPMAGLPLPGRKSGSMKSQLPYKDEPLPPLPPREDNHSGSGSIGEKSPGRHAVLTPTRQDPFSLPSDIAEASSDEESITDEDYVNMYQGMWDCEPDENNELRFKRGEIVHIISTEYDDYGWWIAELGDDVGLVPVSYLMKAYDI